MVEKKENEKKIPRKKIKGVEKVAELIDSNTTIMIVSIKSLPARQFQEIKKNLRGKVEIVIAKKNIILRAIDKAKKKIEEIKPFIKEDTALLFSEMDSFELAGVLEESKTKAKAKIGQEILENIVIEAGATDLIPGPVISELGGLGIKIEIVDGKINIKENKTILKKGDKVSKEAASLMSKLDIKPISVGFIPLASYDSVSSSVYKELIIDKKGAVEKIKDSFSRAKAFAYSIAYYCKETIGLLLAKANAQEEKLGKLSPKEEVIEEKKEEPKEGAKEESKEENAQSDKSEEEPK